MYRALPLSAALLIATLISGRGALPARASGLPDASLGLSPAVDWARQFGTVTQDHSDDVAVDTAGNVYVPWTTDGLFFKKPLDQYDTAISKLDSQGNLLWTQSFESEVTDYASAVEIDPFGNVYFGGGTTAARDNENPSRSGSFLRRIAPDGTVLWDKRFLDGEPGLIDDLSVTSTGQVYAAGPLYTRDDQVGLRSDGIVSRFGADGSLLWRRKFGTERPDVLWAVSADKMGYVFTAGGTSGVLGEQAFGSKDVLIIKLNSDGETVWLRQWGSESYDAVHSIAADREGGAYFAGISASGVRGTDSWTGSDGFVGRYGIPRRRPALGPVLR